MTTNAISKGSLTVFGGNQWRPFIHVKDIGRIIVNNLDTSHTGIFNLATANITIKELGEFIQQETGCEIEVTEEKFQDSRNYHADITKAADARIFNKDTEFTIHYGIREIKDTVSSGRITNLNHDFYSNHKHLLSTIEQYQSSFKEIFSSQ